MNDSKNLQKLFGVGPLGAIISFVLLVIFVWIDRLWVHSAILTNQEVIKIAGVGLAVIGLGLHFWSVWTLRNWWVKDELCTTGPFRWFRHPLYAAWITFILPAFALYLNSWVILCSVFFIHPIWHRLVLKEEEMMLEEFPTEYRKYAAQTGRFFPRPKIT